MTIREQVTKTINNLSDSDLHRVAEYLSFLKFRSKKKTAIDAEKLSELYAKFSDEDRKLAEEGMDDYNKHLLDEEQK